MKLSQISSISLGLVLAACASQPKPQVTPPSTSSGGSTAAPKIPGVKIGNPYEVFGIRYYPEDDRTYDKTGIASWYGPTFHAKPTANGEIYNQEDLTAAHKTLPMPSWVEVTNLDNGRVLVVRINDRGPFVGERIIDLSKRSAEILGVDRPGLANVRVRRIFPEGDWARTTPVGQKPVQVAAAGNVASDATPVYQPAPQPVAVAPVVQKPMATTGAFIQVAALSDEAKARALASVLTDFGQAAAYPSGTGLWRVRIGPVAAENLNNVLFEVQTAGYRDARVVR